MFNNWKVVRTSPEIRVETDKLSEEDAKWLVDMSDGSLYAVNPNGVTYPAGLHDDGDYDPAFGD